MLVLTRKKGESILIGDNIEVRLLSLGRTDARIGIEAPKEMAIDRDEVRKRQARPRAGEDAPGDDERGVS